MDGGTAVTGSSKQKLKQMIKLDSYNAPLLSQSNQICYAILLYPLRFLVEILVPNSIHGLPGLGPIGPYCSDFIKLIEFVEN